MNFSNKNALIYVPDGLEAEAALRRTTRLAVGAHQDDLEIMAAAGILECFHNPEEWFSGVVVTNGSGSPRTACMPTYQQDQEMMLVRVEEQKKAAALGEYAAQVFLDYPSSTVKDRQNLAWQKTFRNFKLSRPALVYTHNLADKHETHVAVALRTISGNPRSAGGRAPRPAAGLRGVAGPGLDAG